MLIVIAAISSLGIAWCSTQSPIATLTLRVVDDEGNPVEGAEAGFSFNVITRSVGGILAETGLNAKEILTDRGGLATASSRCTKRVYYGARKEGYYETSSLEYNYKKLGPTRLYWAPYNPELTVVLKKIIEPVPMYVRRINTQIPALDKPVGFDLEAGDWVVPYGKGKESDFIFEINSRWRGQYDFDTRMKLTFSSSWDGIFPFHQDEHNRGSSLISMQRAPESGYKNMWIQEVSVSPEERRRRGGVDLKQHFAFRVRAKADDQGKIVAANYGKIYNDIQFGSKVIDTELPVIFFTYYYNPNPKSRSLEYDTSRNLAEKNDKTLAP